MLPPDGYARGPCDAPPTPSDVYTPTRVLHVVPGAINGDGSASAPFGSVAAAAAIATPGTFIQLAPGVHATNQFIANLNGMPDAPIWIGGAPGTMPRLINGSEGLHLTKAHYVVIQNLELGNVAANAINIDDGVDYAGDAGPVAIINVYVHDSFSSQEAACIKASGVRNFSVYDSRLRHCGVGIDGVGVRNTVIARNTIETSGSAAVRLRGGSADSDVRQNIIRDGGTTAISLGGYTPLSQFRPALSTTALNAEARRLRAFNNMVTGMMYAPFAFDDCVDCLVAHNYVSGHPARIVRIIQNSTTQGSYAFESTRSGRVINNSFSWTLIDLLSQVETGAGVDPSSFTFSHNLWNCSDSPSSSHPTLPVTEDGSVYNMGTGYNPGDIYPYCYGPEGGKAINMPEIDGTIEGYCRFQGDAPTIGPQMLMSAACGI
jgi:hypothetical protein